MLIQLFKPHAGQKEIIKLLKKPEVRYVIVPAGRRFGKTELAINELTRQGLENDNKKLLYLTVTSDQRSTTFNDYLDKFGDAPFIKTVNRSELNITFENNSKIFFRLASLPAAESLRGKKFDFIICDEFSLYNQVVWETILQPTLATVNNFKALFISTPRGKGHFYNMFKRGLDPNEHKWVSYSAPSWANPLVDLEFIDDVKKQIPEKIFNQEYGAEFLDDSGSIFENISACVNQNLTYTPNKAEKYYAGIDLGFKQDFCVLTIVDKNGNIVDYDRFNDCTMEYAVNRFHEKLKLWNYPITNIENNQYQGIYEMLIKAGCKNIHQFNTNTQSKKEIIEFLIHRFQSKTILLPNEEYLLSEFYDFGYRYNEKTRNVTYAAIGTGHDDIVLSTAMAFKALKDNTNKNFRISIN